MEPLLAQLEFGANPNHHSTNPHQIFTFYGRTFERMGYWKMAKILD